MERKEERKERRVVGNPSEVPLNDVPREKLRVSGVAFLWRQIRGSTSWGMMVLKRKWIRRRRKKRRNSEGEEEAISVQKAHRLDSSE